MTPEKMQKMSPAERKKYVAARQAKRDEITGKIKTLAAKRAKHIKKELAKTKGGKDGFDHKVIETLHRQAARKNIRYKE